MLFYITLLLVFLYFKLVRVHKKEEKLTNIHYISHFIVLISILVLYGFGLKNYSYLAIVITSFIFFIIAALMITAVQVGIFVDGKPFIGMERLYNSIPLIAGVIAVLTLITLLS